MNKNYKKNIEQLHNIKIDINIFSTRLAALQMRKELIEQSEKALNNELSNVDANKVKKIYEEAKILIPNIQKTYEETLAFHNGMINEKLKYITKELPDLNNQITNMIKSLSYLQKKEKKLLNFN